MTDESGDPSGRSTSPAQLRHPHPLVAQALRTVDRRRKDDRGLVPWTPGAHLHLPVSPASFPRAIRFVDALLKACEREGIRATVPRDRRSELVITVEGQPLAIRIREALRNVKIQGTYRERTGYEPTGELQFVIDEYLDLTRKRWGDGPRRGQLEKQLDGIIDGLRKAGEASRLHNEIREREERERRAAEQRRWEAEQRRREEEQRGKELEEEVMRWQRARRIREDLAAVHAAAVTRQVSCEPDTKLGRWLAWAEGYARRLDPLDPGEPPLAEPEASATSHAQP